MRKTLAILTMGAMFAIPGVAHAYHNANFITGTSGPDVLTGTAGEDYIEALGGADLLTGGAGGDLLDAGRGNDIVNARDGEADTIYGGPGFDRVYVDNKDFVFTDSERIIWPN